MHLPFRILLMLTPLWFACGCAAIRPIPKPERQVAAINSGHPAEGPFAPVQKGWNWDERRWFTAELNHSCWGPIRFVDEAGGIDSYVGTAYPPTALHASDDPDVVIALTEGFYENLVYSTDGGKHFVRDVRGFPLGHTIHFIVLRNAHVYVGLGTVRGEAPGYFKWRSPPRLSKYGNDAASNNLLVLLEAPLDKASGRIGRYRLLAPEGYQFRPGQAAAQKDDIKYGASIVSLGLPSGADTSANNACDSTLALPPPWTDNSRDGLLAFYAWFEAQKIQNPAWAVKYEQYMAAHRRRYKVVLDK